MSCLSVPRGRSNENGDKTRTRHTGGRKQTYLGDWVLEGKEARMKRTKRPKREREQADRLLGERQTKFLDYEGAVTGVD